MRLAHAEIVIGQVTFFMLTDTEIDCEKSIAL